MNKWLRRLFRIPRRLELRLVSYAEADWLLQHEPGWRIAKEEDKNYLPLVVYLERISYD